MTTEQMDEKDAMPQRPTDSASRRAEQMAAVRERFDSGAVPEGVPTISTDEFDPPLTRTQAEQVQAFINTALLFRESRDAWTTRGSRNPNTLAGMLPVSAYNLGWKEGRESVAEWQELTFSEETMFKVQAAITANGIWGQQALDIIAAMQNSGILFRERIDGDSDPVVGPITEDDYPRSGPRVDAILKAVAATDDVPTQAEEPIDDRLRRTWLNGFREGFERSAYIGRLDHS